MKIIIEINDEKISHLLQQITHMFLPKISIEPGKKEDPIPGAALKESDLPLEFFKWTSTEKIIYLMKQNCNIHQMEIITGIFHSEIESIIDNLRSEYFAITEEQDPDQDPSAAPVLCKIHPSKKLPAEFSSKSSMEKVQYLLDNGYNREDMELYTGLKRTTINTYISKIHQYQPKKEEIKQKSTRATYTDMNSLPKNIQNAIKQKT